MTETLPPTFSEPTVSGQVMRDGAGRLWLDVPRLSACQSCDKTSTCSMSVLGGLAGSASMRLPVEGVDLHSGDRVTVACSSNGLLKSAFLAYGLPSLGLVVGAAMMAVMNFDDGAQALGAGLGLILGVMITRWAVARGHLPALTYFEE
ncbi:MAG: SoxR reducing system RseC family protein [Rhodospirillales bacterium]|nr:SoxR reducing system RseC family protein [Rhodospirillales bacterium]